MTCFFAFAVATGPLEGGWNPQTCIQMDDTAAFGVLQDASYLGFKNLVFDELRDSWCSQEKADMLMDLVVLTRPKVCVEIGVFTGASLVPVLAALSFTGTGTAYGVDSWSNLDAVRGLSPLDQHYRWWLAVDMGEARQIFADTMVKWSFPCDYKVIQAPSKKAVSRFEQIDFLHIDGNFSEQGALEDVMLYLPKVAPGGYILLSNLLITVDGYYTKMKALWALMDQCETIAEIEGSNAALFQKPYQ